MAASTSASLVFISYASADSQKAYEIAQSLEMHGHKTWIAPRDVRPGRTYGDEIISGIEKSSSVVLVLSSAANTSPFVAREIERATSKRKPIFPIRIENVLPAPSLELFVGGTHWIDAWSGTLSSHVDRLARFLSEEATLDTAYTQQLAPAEQAALTSRAARQTKTSGRIFFRLWVVGLVVTSAIGLWLALSQSTTSSGVSQLRSSSPNSTLDPDDPRSRKGDRLPDSF